MIRIIRGAKSGKDKAECTKKASGGDEKRFK